MSDPPHPNNTTISAELPLNRTSIQHAHAAIKSHIHETPVLTNRTLNALASRPQTQEALRGTPWENQRPAHPRMNFFFKCENLQRVGAFKARGAFHAISRLKSKSSSTSASDSTSGRDVITNSSGNHAQALALAARESNLKAHVVMPTISTPSKIAATKGYGANVVFSGSTSQEREEVMARVQAETQAIYVPPYDHPDIVLGQGTVGLEMEAQVAEMVSRGEAGLSVGSGREKGKGVGALDVVLVPLGGGGLLSGIATWFADTPTAVFGAEPSYQGADDATRGLSASPPQRITSVKSLTIADGLRTPVGILPWSIISDTAKVRGVFSVTESQIRDAMRLVLERVKVVVEPSAVVGLAVALYNEDFRRVVEREGGGEKDGGWNVGVVFSGGNTTVEAICALFGEGAEGTSERAEGKVGMNGSAKVENVPG